MGSRVQLNTMAPRREISDGGGFDHMAKWVKTKQVCLLGVLPPCGFVFLKAKVLCGVYWGPGVLSHNQMVLGQKTVKKK